MAEDQAVGAPERLHWSTILASLRSGVRGIWGLGAAGAYFAASSRWLLVAAIAIAFLVFTVGAALLRWWRFSYRVGVDEIRVDSGLVNRTSRSIPFDRIQDVDISQGLLARFLGVARVKFETGSGADGGSDDGILHAIALDRAEQLRKLVRGHPSGGAEYPSGHEPPADQAPVYAMAFGRLLLAGLFNFSLALFAGLFGLTQTLGGVAGLDPFSRKFWLPVLSAGDPIANFLLAHRLAAAIAGALLLLLIGLATGIARTVVREFGFRLDRVDAGLRRRRGLLTRTDVTLPVKRAQAALIVSGPVRDAFGWRELKLQTLARDEGGKGDHVLAPLADDGEIAAIISEFGWRWPPELPVWTRVSPAYVWTFAIALSPLLLLALAQASVGLVTSGRGDEFAPLLVPALLGMVVLGGAVVARWMGWRRTCYALDGERLLVRTGWWRRRLLLLPLERLQSVDIKNNAVTRRFGISTLVFGVAGGSGFSAHSIPAVPSETARALRDELLIRTS